VAEWLLAQFPDIHMTIEAIVSESRFSARQTHWFRVADGKLAEHWATRDDLTAMIQLGVVRPPGPPAGDR
jgi:predicted ester cyclase